MTEAELQQTLWSIITTEPVMLTNAHSALLSYQAAGDEHAIDLPPGTVSAAAGLG